MPSVCAVVNFKKLDPIKLLNNVSLDLRQHRAGGTFKDCKSLKSPDYLLIELGAAVGYRSRILKVLSHTTLAIPSQHLPNSCLPFYMHVPSDASHLWLASHLPLSHLPTRSASTSHGSHVLIC